MALCIGIAIDKGYIENVDKNILDYFSDYRVKENQSFNHEITIKDLLTMKIHFKNDEDNFKQYFLSKDWANFALDNVIGKSENFIYSPLIGLDILSKVIKQSSSKTLLDYAKAFLFEPLDINVEQSLSLTSLDDHNAFNSSNAISGWASDSKHNNAVGWGLSLSTLDLAKIGELILKDGIYNKKRIVSKKWLYEMLLISNEWKEMSLNYGYLWWILDEDIYAALGDGGNTLLIDKQKNIVVSITGYYTEKQGDRLQFIFESLLPSLHL